MFASLLPFNLTLFLSIFQMSQTTTANMEISKSMQPTKSKVTEGLKNLKDLGELKQKDLIAEQDCTD